MKIMYALLWKVLAFAAISHAYILDGSCTSDLATQQLIERGLQDAFDSARIAQEALARRPWNREHDGPLMDLADWIFKEDGSAQPITEIGFPPHSPMVMHQFPNDKRNSLDQLQDVFMGILLMKDKLDRGNKYEVEIFCDLSRFDPPDTKKNRVWDRTRKIFFFIGKDSRYSCSAPLIQAWTSAGGSDGEPYILQICPEYLKKNLQAPYTSTADFKKLPKTGTPGWPVPNTAMDVNSLLDNTLLHEMAHTFSGGYLDDKGLLLGPYGWTNILKTNKERAIQNADSVAYFALGARMILTQNHKPNKDGSISEL